jgi:ATP-dependent helicase/nuclease subunit A
MSGGEIRRANLDALCERAAKYERSNLFNFITYIEKLQKSGAEFSGAKAAGDGDAVRVMSAHKSKGLEFPVVFVCGLGRRINTRDASAPLICHQDLGLASVYVDIKDRVRYNTLPRYAISRKIIAESLSEEVRVLYVALTRAREKLILTASCADFKKLLSSEAARLQGGAASPYYLSRKRRFLDLIVCALTRSRGVLSQFGQDAGLAPDDAPPIVVKLFPMAEFASRPKPGRASRLPAPEDALSGNGGRRAEIERSFAFVYPYAADAAIPSKISITEIKRLMYANDPDGGEIMIETKSGGPDYRPPAFMSESAESAAREGAALHAVMERLDMRAHQTIGDILGLIGRMVLDGIFSDEDAARARSGAGMIERFVKTPLAERMRRSSHIMRETPFVYAVDPAEINPEWRGASGRPLVHGIIDCVFEEDGGYVLLDYKSDRVSEENVSDALKRYAVQMDVYKKAFEAASGDRIKQSLIYFMRLGRSFELT